MKQKTLLYYTVIFCLGTLTHCSKKSVSPVTPGTSPEARALLRLLYDISGRYILTGQHNYPNTHDRNSQFAAKYTGRTPAIWSTDWGFAEDGDTDSYLARPDIVNEAIRQHEKGSLVTICWHAVPPTADEPVTFRPPPGERPPDSLVSVQGQLLDQQFRDVLTPGTELNRRWCAQVDTVAFYLKKLQQARVPVLWRPYHEMNGNWFWWGGRLGETGTRALYQQIFERLVKYHKINNLIWIWSVDRPNRPEMNFSNFYPGNDYLDVLALDVYGSDFNQAYYDSLIALSQGKPLVLGEVGNPPGPEILDTQPNWSYWVVWAGMVRNTTKKQYQILFNDPRILCQEDAAYRRIMKPFRKACGLPALPRAMKRAGAVIQAETEKTAAIPATAPQTTGFSGTWIFNEEKSALDDRGAANVPYRLNITLDGLNLDLVRSQIVEWGDDRVTHETLFLDGRESHSKMGNAPRTTSARKSQNGDTLTIESKTVFARDGRQFEWRTIEAWTVGQETGDLQIEQSSTTWRGGRQITLVYDRER
jgi:mannan endo-1,4-beta-mannosidase